MGFLSTELRPLRVVKVFLGASALVILVCYVCSRLMEPTWTELQSGHTPEQAMEIMGEPTDRIYDPPGQVAELWYSAGAEQYKLIFRDGHLARLQINGGGKGIRLKEPNVRALSQR